MTSADAALGRRERHKRETRERILDAALECVLERGFDQATMDEIAARADVARATVFNHFPVKEQFLSAYLERRRVLVRELLQREADEGVDAARRLYDAMELLARLNEGRVDEVRTLLFAWRRTGGSPSSEPDTGRVLGQVIESGQKAGQLRTDSDPYAIGALLLDAYIGVLLRWIPDVGDEPRFPLDEALREVCDVVIEGLRA
jgi:TetR/AcrR family transcriptional regulator, cholesterol catabolism regulator